MLRFISRAAIAFGCACALATGAIAASTIQISGPAQLKRALAGATGGETFVLAPGDYGALSISRRTFKTAITIASANPLNPARFGDTKLTNSSGIAFSGVDFINPLDKSAGERAFTPAVIIRASSGISFDQVSVRGSLNGNPADDGYGIVVSDSSKISVTRSDFTELVRGLVFRESSDISITDNRLSFLRSDGINLAGVQGVKIDANRFSDFFPAPGDHSDAIQFWTKGSSKPSRDIQISDNLIVAAGDTQGIFMRANYAGFEMPYEDVVISDNILSGTAWHGITLGSGEDVRVEDNTIFSLPGIDVRWSWILLQDIENLALVDNIAAKFLLDDVGNPFVRSGNQQLFLGEVARLAAIAQWDLLHGGRLPDEPGDPRPDGPGYNTGAFNGAVPEPATWAMLILGFGVIGAALRRRRPIRAS